MRFKPVHLFLFSLLLMVVGPAFQARAVTSIWTGAGADANWGTSGNWAGGAVPGQARDFVWFGNDGLGTSRLDQAYTVRVLVVTNSSQTQPHVMDLNGYTLTLTNALQVGYQTNNSYCIISNGTLRMGTSSNAANLDAGYNTLASGLTFTNNRLTVQGVIEATNLNRIYVGYNTQNQTPDTTQVEGIMDLSGATFVSRGVTNRLEANALNVGGGFRAKGTLLLNPAITEIVVGKIGVPGTGMNYLRGRLNLGPNSQLRMLVVTNTFSLGMGGPGFIDNWPTNVEFQVGLPNKPGECNIGRNDGWGKSEGYLALTGGLFRAYVTNLNVGLGDQSYSDAATGVLDLASTTVLIGNETNKVKLDWLSIGGEGANREASNGGGGVGLLKLPATVTDIECNTFDLGNSYNYGVYCAGILDLGGNSQLARLTVSNSFYMGSGSLGALVGLPTNTEIRIGTASKPATMKVASKLNAPSRAALALTNNPVWLYLSYLQVADNASWQYGGPSGTLNLAQADLRAFSVTGAFTLAASLGGLTNKDVRGFVMLPAADATSGSLLVGNRHGGSRGILELFGTRLAVTQFVFVGNSGVITNHLLGAPGGLDLVFGATNLFNVAPTGRIVLAFDANPTNASAFTWGLRMAGDARPHVQNLKDTGRLSWTTPGLSAFWTNRISIVYTNSKTQVGLEAAPTLTVVAESASDITPSSATLQGTLISAGGGEPARVHVVWDTADSGTTSLEDWESRQVFGAFTDGQPFQTNLTGLLSGTTYTFRCFASNSTGTAWSEPLTFQTIYAPVVSNTGAGNIGYFNARLQGQILETGWDTPVCRIYYWEAGSGATNVIPMGSQSGSFGSVITNLSLGTTYAYYFTASNSAGVAVSPVQSFNTLVGTTWCVATGGLESATGTNWDNPLRSVSNALGKAKYGDLILVTNGNYYLAAVISVTNAVYMKSLAGADFTLLNGSNTMQVLKVSHASAEVRGFTLTNGYAYSAVTGIPGADVSAGILRDSRILDCMYAVGGTVAGLRLSGTSAKAERCVIANNYLDRTQAGGGVGGVLISAGMLSQCLVTRNRSSATPNTTGDFLVSAGVSQSGGVVQHCTIAGNIGNGGTLGGLRQTGGAVSNSIIAWNYDPRYAVGDHANDPNVRQTGAGTIAYSCTVPEVAGTGNVEGDPRFSDLTAGDFRLMPGSPALDAGAPISQFGADGLGGPKDGDGDGVAAADMGCLEALAAGDGDFRLGFSAFPLSGVASQTVVFTAAAAGSDPELSNYEWSFGDSQTLSGAGLTNVSHGYGPGVYPVSLTVTRSVGGTVSASLPVSLYVAPAEVYVSTNGGCVFPFDTWVKATTNLQDAIEAAGSNPSTSTVVRVAAGTYRIGKYFPIQVRKPVRVRSEEGPARTILTRVLDVYCYQLVHVVHPDAVLEGFTITNGFGGLTAQWNYCGGGVYMSAGTLRNCWVVGGEAPNGGGIWMQGGLVDRCKVAGNKANNGNGYGCGGGVYAEAGTVRNSLVLQNMTTHTNTTAPGAGISLFGANARAENCTVVDNVVSNGIAGPTYSGGGIYRKVDGAAVVNCIVTGNTKAGLPNDIASSGATTNGIRYTCSPDVRAGNGNTAADPAFLNAAAGDYRLSGVSPCIDTGEVQAWTMTGLDYAGRERYKGKGVDMGAIESRPLPGTLIMIY